MEMKFKARILNVLFWSVISAAFIGPGTVTTAAKAGSAYGYSLIWALVFSTLTCLLLQEAGARITIVTGKNLGQAIAWMFRSRSSRVPVLLLVVGAIIFGSAAYQTGNLLGAMSGITLLHDGHATLIIALLGLAAGIALFLPGVKKLAIFLGFIVVIMGFCFLVMAFMVPAPIGEVLRGSFTPSVPEGSGLIILGLVGTTVVPYNIFLGSGVADERQSLREMRFGLSVAIIFGGIISIAVLVAGTLVGGAFTFGGLGQALSEKLGGWALYMFSIGLFAAGFSSAITAPLASAVTARSLFGEKRPEGWKDHGLLFRMVWGFVLLTGMGFGMAGFKPIPAIITAQALNGLILPLISIFLLFVINNPAFMGKHNLNRPVSNTLMFIAVWITLVLGVFNILKIFEKQLFTSGGTQYPLLEISGLTMLIVTALIFSRVVYLRRKKLISTDI